MYIQRNYKKKLSIEKKTVILTEHTLLYHINRWSWQEWPISNSDSDWWRYGDDDDDDNDNGYDNDDDDDETCSK